MASGVEEYDEQSVPLCDELWAVELDEAVTSLAVSSDGTKIAAGTLEDELPVLDAGSGARSALLPGHAGGVNGVGFLSSGALASVGEDGKASIWDISSGTVLQSLDVKPLDADRTSDGHTVSCLAISADGSRFAAAAGRSVTQFGAGGSGEGGGALVARVLPDSERTVNGLRYDARGDLLSAAHGGVSRHSFLEGGKEVKTLDLPYEGTCLAVDGSASGQWTAAGCTDSLMHVFRVAPKGDGADVSQFTCGGYPGKVSSLEFDPAGVARIVAAGGPVAVLWEFGDNPDGQQPTMMSGHEEAITALAWRPTHALGGEGAGAPEGARLQQLVLTGSKGGVALLFDPEDAEPGAGGQPDVCAPAACADTEGDAITCLAWCPTGQAFYTGHQSGHVRKWALPKGDEDSSDDDESGSSDGEGSDGSSSD